MPEWPVELETALFRAICQVKPVGIHKHFRMVEIIRLLNSSLHEINSNYNNTPNNGVTEHLSWVSNNDIWSKLGELYDLKGLDELDDEEWGKVSDFDLPWNDYGHIIVQHRKAVGSDAADSSPALLSTLDASRHPASKSGDGSSKADADLSSVNLSDEEEPTKETKPTGSSRKRGGSTRPVGRKRGGAAAAANSAATRRSQTSAVTPEQADEGIEDSDIPESPTSQPPKGKKSKASTANVSTPKSGGSARKPPTRRSRRKR